MTWRNPWMFVLLVLLLPIWWQWLRRAARSAARFSSIERLKSHRSSLRIKTRHVVPLLRTLAVGLLVICLARPQQPNQETRILSEGVAIQMLVDRSSSMGAMDFTVGTEPANRLTAAKMVFKEFVLGGEHFAGRPDDRMAREPPLAVTEVRHGHGLLVGTRVPHLTHNSDHSCHLPSGRRDTRSKPSSNRVYVWEERCGRKFA